MEKGGKKELWKAFILKDKNILCFGEKKNNEKKKDIKTSIFVVADINQMFILRNCECEPFFYLPCPFKTNFSCP